jgi:hypothetical protein
MVIKTEQHTGLNEGSAGSEDMNNFSGGEEKFKKCSLYEEGILERGKKIYQDIISGADKGLSQDNPIQISAGDDIEKAVLQAVYASFLLIDTDDTGNGKTYEPKKVFLKAHFTFSVCFNSFDKISGLPQFTVTYSEELLNSNPQIETIKKIVKDIGGSMVEGQL